MATNRLITMSPVDIYIGVTTNVGNAYTAGSPPVGGYAANILYDCTFNATNTGAATLDGHTLLRNGVALSGGEFAANSDVLLRFDGTNFELMNYAISPGAPGPAGPTGPTGPTGATGATGATGPTSGALLSHNVVTTGTSYTVSASTNHIVVECVGGGGGGGGCTSAVGSSAAGGGGSGGGYSRKFFTVTPSASYTYAIGAGGSGGSNTGGNGGNGGNTTFIVGATTVNGSRGLGGAGMVATSVISIASGGTSTSPGGGDLNVKGTPGEDGIVFSSAVAMGGAGGNSFYGSGAGPNANGFAGSAGQQGSGGSGGSVLNNSGAVTGGAGGAGIIVVWEYS